MPQLQSPRVVIVSDNLEAVVNATSARPSRPLTQQRWDEAQYWIQRHCGEVHFRWTKSHQGLLGNETADQLAKEAAAQKRPGMLGHATLAHTVEAVKKWPTAARAEY
jgi:ribonuclease HI